MKKASKEKQQVWNRGRSELLGADHKQARTVLRAELAPGYYISNSGKKAIKVLHSVDLTRLSTHLPVARGLIPVTLLHILSSLVPDLSCGHFITLPTHSRWLKVGAH